MTNTSNYHHALKPLRKEKCRMCARICESNQEKHVVPAGIVLLSEAGGGGLLVGKTLLDTGCLLGLSGAEVCVQCAALLLRNRKDDALQQDSFLLYRIFHSPACAPRP